MPKITFFSIFDHVINIILICIYFKMYHAQLNLCSNYYGSNDCAHMYYANISYAHIYQIPKKSLKRNMTIFLHVTPRQQLSENLSFLITQMIKFKKFKNVFLHCRTQSQRRADGTGAGDSAAGAAGAKQRAALFEGRIAFGHTMECFRQQSASGHADGCARQSHDRLGATGNAL